MSAQASDSLRSRSLHAARAVDRAADAAERLTAAIGEDVSPSSSWLWRFLLTVWPRQIGNALEVYHRMPRHSPTKLKQL